MLTCAAKREATYQAEDESKPFKAAIRISILARRDAVATTRRKLR
jgi:hypothetical protein